MAASLSMLGRLRVQGAIVVCRLGGRRETWEACRVANDAVAAHYNFWTTVMSTASLRNRHRDL